MTLEDIIREASYGIKENAVQMDLKGFINRANRTIAERYNWSALHDIRPVTVPSGYSFTKMSADFKQLSEEDSPVSFVYGQYQLPAMVVTRSQMQMWGIWPFPNGPLCFPVPGGNFPVRVVFFERNAGGLWELHIPPQFSLTQDAVFLVQGYYYPAPLVKGDDTNPFTTDGNLSQAIISLTQCYAFRAMNPTDKRGDAAKFQAEDYIKEAMYADALIKRGGVALRM